MTTRPPAAQALWLHRTMVAIREFEDRLYHLFLTEAMPGTMHQYTGQEAVAAGVEVQPGIQVNGISTAPGGVTVSGSGKTFDARYAIAADGCNSGIAKMMGFNRDRVAYCYLFSKGWYMSNVAAPATDVLISSITYKTVAPGYMFIFPRPYGDDLTVVFLSLDPRVNLDEVARLNDDLSTGNDDPALIFKSARSVSLSVPTTSASYDFSELLPD